MRRCHVYLKNILRTRDIFHKIKKTATKIHNPELTDEKLSALGTTIEILINIFYLVINFQLAKKIINVIIQFFHNNVDCSWTKKLCSTWIVIQKYCTVRKNIDKKNCSNILQNIIF